jgi:FYVE zinc finger
LTFRGEEIFNYVFSEIVKLKTKKVQKLKSSFKTEKEMSNCCNTCAKGFGFFTKEHGCPRCKRVFCKNCLGHKVPESADLRKFIYVCLKCSKIPLNDASPSKKEKQENIEEMLYESSMKIKTFFVVFKVEPKRRSFRTCPGTDAYNKLH